MNPVGSFGSSPLTFGAKKRKNPDEDQPPIKPDRLPVVYDEIIIGESNHRPRRLRGAELEAFLRGATTDKIRTDDASGTSKQHSKPQLKKESNQSAFQAHSLTGRGTSSDVKLSEGSSIPSRQRISAIQVDIEEFEAALRRLQLAKPRSRKAREQKIRLSEYYRYNNKQARDQYLVCFNKATEALVPPLNSSYLDPDSRPGWDDSAKIESADVCERFKYLEANPFVQLDPIVEVLEALHELNSDHRVGGRNALRDLYVHLQDPNKKIKKRSHDLLISKGLVYRDTEDPERVIVPEDVRRYGRKMLHVEDFSEKIMLKLILPEALKPYVHKMRFSKDLQEGVAIIYVKPEA